MWQREPTIEVTLLLAGIKGTEVDAWCKETFGPWISDDFRTVLWSWSGSDVLRHYQFKNEKDAMLFMLRWGCDDL